MTVNFDENALAMPELNRAALVVRPALPYIHWARHTLGDAAGLMTTDVLHRQSGVYLVDQPPLGGSLDAVLDRYWQFIFDRELSVWTPREDLWPQTRDRVTFHQWFDVELRDRAVDIGLEAPLYDVVDHALNDSWDRSWDDNDGVSYGELFPPSPFDDPEFHPVPPRKGKTQGLIHQFKIALTGIKPPIWRRFQVPAGYSFWDLHVAITDAMGWLDSHLHLFSVRNPETGALDPIGIYDDDEPDGPSCLPDDEYPIAAYFRSPGDRAWYTYDYGDFWVHDVVLEDILPRPKGRRYPLCVDGARACPPEDVGGIPGYHDLLEAQDDPSHPEYEVYRNWLGGRFDPEAFDPAEVKFDSPRKRWEFAFLGE